MFSNLLSMLGKSYYPIVDALYLANHVVPLSVGKQLRQPFPDLTDGSLSSHWVAFASKFPNGKTVKLIPGSLPTCPTCALSLGTFLFKNSPKVIVVDIGLQRLDSEAASWFCKHEFARINHSDSIKQYLPLLITSVTASFFCTDWYSSLLIGYATHILAEKTFGLRAEINADHLAVENAVEQELKGAIRFFEATIQAGHELCPQNSFSNTTKKFVVELLTRRPFYKERMEKIEAVLKSKFNYTQKMLDDIKKDDRVLKLKQYTVFRATTPVTDPKYAEKAMVLLSTLGVSL